MFQQLPHSLNQLLAKDLTEISMIVKYVLFRLRFRENIQGFPTLRLVTINDAMELHKVISIRQGQGLWSLGIEKMSESLKNIVGF